MVHLWVHIPKEDRVLYLGLNSAIEILHCCSFSENSYRKTFCFYLRGHFVSSYFFLLDEFFCYSSHSFDIVQPVLAIPIAFRRRRSRRQSSYYNQKSFICFFAEFLTLSVSFLKKVDGMGD